MGNEVSYRNFEKFVDRLEELNYEAIIFGSWFLPFYIEKNSNMKIYGIGRETDDIDIFVSDKTITNELDPKVGRDVIFAGGVYHRGAGIVDMVEPDPYDFDENAIKPIDVDTFIEIFPREYLTSLNKDIKKLEDYLSTKEGIEENTDMVTSNIRVVKPWLWVAFKTMAYQETEKESHRHDLAYFKGIIGETKFRAILSEMVEKLGPKYMTEYQKIFSNKVEQSQVSLCSYNKQSRRRQKKEK